MDPSQWSVLLVTANKFEATLQTDVLRGAGVRRLKLYADSQTALAEAGGMDANIVIIAADAQPIAAFDWIRSLRRMHTSPARKSSVFVTSPALTASVVSQCRIGGANAAIGLPISNASLVNTVKKVLASQRPFIDCEVYVGPCRRAGIVVAGAGHKRRRSDDEGAGVQAESLSL